MITFLQKEAQAQDFALPLTKDSFKSTLDAYSIGVHATVILCSGGVLASQKRSSILYDCFNDRFIKDTCQSGNHSSFPQGYSYHLIQLVMSSALP